MKLITKELENIKLPFGLTIERDLYSKGTVFELYSELALYTESVEIDEEPDYEER